ADPLDEPPGINRSSTGFLGVPKYALIPVAAHANSSRLVLPMIRTSPRRSAALTPCRHAASSQAGFATAASAWLPAVVTCPSISSRSLTATRTGPASSPDSKTLRNVDTQLLGLVRPATEA